MNRWLGIIAALLVGLLAPGQALAKTYKLAWSHYTGWEPWGYAADTGLIKKWAQKYGIEIEVALVNDYVESVNLYTSGAYDAVAVTNMDALSIPCVGGVDTTALILGDFSNGNDGIVMKGGNSVADLRGREIKLVQLSVSHYLLARALEKNKLSERDVKIINTSDADIGSVFASGGTQETAVTWNPILMSVRNAPGANLVFDSSSIPGEILDMLVVRTKADEPLKKALVGAWYEALAVMAERAKPGDEAIARMAAQAGGTEAEFRAQLKTTSMFYRPADAVVLARSAELKDTMKYVARFLFEHGLFGERAQSADRIGIQFPDGTVQGDAKNVKLRFDATYMDLAAQGKL